MIIQRPLYIEKIKPFIDVKIVKILSGIRRCGKTTILEMVKQELLSRGVDEKHIITRRYTNVDYGMLFDSFKMYKELQSFILDKHKYYFLLDELQEITGWEKVVNTLLEEYDTDIYITGSNSKLMSGEISTYLTGRYITIPVYTLSFKEYLTFKNNTNKSIKEHLQDYIRLGGFPLIASGNFDEKAVYAMIEDIYNSVVMNDITNKHKINNTDLFHRVVRFVIENVGKTFSANSIVNFLKSEKRTISIETIYNYLDWLEKAFVIYRCRRYDLKGKNILKTQEKFYLADQSIRYALYGFNPTSISSMIENLVFFELKRRGYEVYIGKNENKEIDFVAIKRDEKIYIQACRQLPKESDREIANLMEINDHYPKFVVTLDDYASGNINGIQIVHLADFLLIE